ncbi:hypothetical protein ACJJTC_017665 [Scirpophaga incertulas]
MAVCSLSMVTTLAAYWLIVKNRNVRRPSTPSGSNATRDSQLLSVLAARRRQLLTGRLTTHINTLAALAHKANKTNTTFAQLEIRDSNNSIVKRLTFDNSSNEPIPTLKLVTTDGTKEVRQLVKPHEIRHLFIPKGYQDGRGRAAFMNSRKKDFSNTTKSIPNNEPVTEIGIVYVPPEKLEGLDKEVDLDPDEEFQVDESNHGLYLLNYSNTDNMTKSIDSNKTISNEIKENSTIKIEATTINYKNITRETLTEKPEISLEDKTESNVIANSTDFKSTKLIKIESDKEKENHTLFMSDEIYNHFRPLEPELPVEDMAPFIYFGQKLGGQNINDNLTNSPSLSASTKSINFIVAPPDKRKFNSRYSATEKYRSASTEEEEVNEDMDVSVVKNIIEKNKIRNSVKGPAPSRSVGLVNAYRKYSSTTQATTKSPSISQLNVTEPIIQNPLPAAVKVKDIDRLNVTNFNENTNFTQDIKDSLLLPKNNNVILPKNYTRNYFNIRRRPNKVTLSPSTENILLLNATTTEKGSTSVYTAVVTSVSITSSVKGQNKTDSANKDTDNSTLVIITTTTITSTTLSPPTSPKSYKHRIRIRTTTTENSINLNPSPRPITLKPIGLPLASELSTRNFDLTNEATSKLPERLYNLYKPNFENSPPGNSTRPKNILRRRRPTTTTSTSTTSTTSTSPIPFLYPAEKISQPPIILTTSSPATIASTTLSQTTETMTTTFKPFIVTSRTSSESISRPIPVLKKEITVNETVNTVNITTENSEEDIDSSSQNEEVVIEAEKSYTASYVLAGLGFLPVAAIIAFVLRNILNKKTKEIDTDYEGYFEDGDIKKESQITPVARPPLPTPTKPDQKWEFPRNKLRLQTLLGQGNFGQVWKAEADDLTGHDGLTRLVAVKSIKETASQKEKQELLHEIYIMQKIGTHPNVVTLLGCCTEQEPFLLIMEYVMCGKLLTYLRERRSRPDRFSGSGALTSRDLTVFAYCVARGMEYIASKGIVHRDLAARNVLVDHNKLCKIADFGMSRSAGEASRAARSALPVRWMAPEALLYNAYSHHSDVWAFGILLWEIVTLGSTPYATMSGRQVAGAVAAGLRPARPAHCAPRLYRAMHAETYVDLDSFYQDSSVYSDPSAIINDDDGLSAEYDRDRRCLRELTKSTPKQDNRAFSFRDEELRNKFGIGTPRMGGFGIRDVPFNDRNFSDGEFNERNFNDKNFTDTDFNERNFKENNFSDPNFTERKDGKLSTASFHRERERENPIVSRNSFNGFPRIGTRENHFQMNPDGRNKRVSEFECDI